MAPAVEAKDGSLVAEKLWRPLDDGEGPRIGVLGDSRCGKTEAMRHLIQAYRRRCPGIVLIVDDKEPQAQFEGQLRRDRDDLEHNKPDPNLPPIIVFRGDKFDRVTGEVDPASIAEIQWTLAQKRRPSLVVYDELDKAANNGQWKGGDKSAVRWAFHKGGGLGASSLWGTQETQSVPSGAFNQSSAILCFRMLGAPLRLLKERGYLEGGVESVIPTLPGDELPAEDRGYFVLLERGRPWDGERYRFKKK